MAREMVGSYLGGITKGVLGMAGVLFRELLERWCICYREGGEGRGEERGRCREWLGWYLERCWKDGVYAIEKGERGGEG